MQLTLYSSSKNLMDKCHVFFMITENRINFQVNLYNIIERKLLHVVNYLMSLYMSNSTSCRNQMNTDLQTKVNKK